jgi:hypothetical protein
LSFGEIEEFWRDAIVVVHVGGRRDWRLVDDVLLQK